MILTSKTTWERKDYSKEEWKISLTNVIDSKRGNSNGGWEMEIEVVVEMIISFIGISISKQGYIPSHKMEIAILIVTLTKEIISPIWMGEIIMNMITMVIEIIDLTLPSKRIIRMSVNNRFDR